MGALFESVVGSPPEPLYLPLAAAVLLASVFYGLLAILHLIAPKPRPVLPSEKTYITTSPDSNEHVRKQLPCWHDHWLAGRQESDELNRRDDSTPDALHSSTGLIESAEVLMSVVFPAYNEEDRILPTLEEAVKYLDETYGRPTQSPDSDTKRSSARDDVSGYEIIVVNDGSNDKTVDVALKFARENDLHDILRVVTLEKNRGKGGSVTHGMRHVRGAYALFADADGASRFSDLAKLVEGCDQVVDSANRGVAIGSRAHLVGSEAVVKRSALRNFLMRSFHLVLTILTPPATSRIRDTQCGFKLFSRAALPHIIPYMHAEGWIFDIEMLMLAESAPAVPVVGSDRKIIAYTAGIKVAEVPIDWHEVGGSKLNVIQDSIKMAIGLAVLRASWMLGVYRRRL
ncbi:glycosyltransferase family 2 protein [Xylaria sp. CBS 124048]|nr:glycosyltransferase family 2 protein [Xylaria sp. CBS 124048]